jgi:hypothetical protein
MFKKNDSAKKCVAPLEPPDANGRAVDFDHFSRRKWTRARDGLSYIDDGSGKIPAKAMLATVPTYRDAYQCQCRRHRLAETHTA